MWICKNCKEEVEDNFDVCWNCGSERSGETSTEPTKEVYQNNKEEIQKIIQNKGLRYPALRLISGIFRIVAWLAGIAALIIIYKLISSNSDITFVLGTLVIGAILTISLLAISEIIIVLVDIEENTRTPNNKT